MIALAIAACAFVAAYVGCDALGLPTIWYRPLEHRWTFSAGHGIAMGWYGHVLEGYGVAAVALAASRLALRRARPSPRLAGLAVLGSVSAFLFAVVIELARV